jgi:hypothetical protein
MSLPDLTCEYLLLDASSAISLYASRRFQEIVASLPLKAAIIDLVRQKEVRFVWDGPEENIRQLMEPIDLQPLIDRSLITEVSLDDNEYVTMVNLAARNLGNGESAAAAVALHRGWGICTDDFEALPRIRKVVPGALLTVTSQLLYHWATSTNASDRDIRMVVQAMRLRGSYGLSKKEPLMEWLKAYITHQR